MGALMPMHPPCTPGTPPVQTQGAGWKAVSWKAASRGLRREYLKSKDGGSTR